MTMYCPIKLSQLLPLLGLSAMMVLNGCTSSGTGVMVRRDFPVEPDRSMTTTLPAEDPFYASEGYDSTATYHTVSKGENLYRIAMRYGRDYREVARWNNIPPPYTISPGQRLKITPARGSYTASQYGSYTPDTRSYPVKSTSVPSGTAIGHTTTKSAKSGGGATYHTVQPGETLYAIAGRYRQSLQSVGAWNNIPAPYTSLQVGQQLQVSPPVGWTASSSSYSPPVNHVNTSVSSAPMGGFSSGTVYHTVDQGDTLYNIAQRYGRSVAEVAAWNGLQAPFPPLSVGQTLIVNPADTGKTVFRSQPQPTSRSSSSLGTMPIATAPIPANGYHIVASGDTLFNVARRYGHNIGEIASWNGMTQPYQPIFIGQKIRVIPTTVSATSSRSSSSTRLPAAARSNARSNISYHIVQSGETLHSVAQSYGLTSHEVSIWNGIGSPYTVYPGQKLLIVPP